MLSIVAIMLITFLANIIGILSGFGVGTVMTPVLLLFLPFSQTIFLVAIIHWFHNIWKVFFFKKGIDWRLFLLFGIPSLITTFIGALFVVGKPEFLIFLLGFFLIIYSLFLLLFPYFEVPRTRFNAIIGGGLSGFTAGLFGMRGAVRSAFLTAYKLPRATFLGTTGAISMLIDTTRLFVYWGEGVPLGTEMLAGLLFFIPASFLGSYIGRLLVKRVPHGKFRAVVALFLLAIGLYFVTSYLL